MARPIWTGAISFGLLHIPIQLMAAERRVDLSFHMLDGRNNARVRYRRINAETGEEVPWGEIVKAFEYEKGSYVVLSKEDLKEAAPQSAESVDIQSFIDADSLSPNYYERPYYLVPQKKSEKGYVLLRDTLRETGKAGLARVVIRTREYLALVVVQGDALMLLLLRYPEELIEPDSYSFPDAGASHYRISKKEIEMARQLVTSMSGEWSPAEYKDEFRERLSEAIQTRVRRKTGKKVKAAAPDEAAASGSGKVVDFMALLKKSLDENKRTPAAGKKRAAKARPARRKTA